MAWNGSTQGIKKEIRTGSHHKNHPSKLLPLKRIIVGVVIFVSACVAIFLCRSRPDESPQPSAPKHKPIQDKGKTINKPIMTKQVKEEPVSYKTNRWGEVVKRKKPETYTDEMGVLRYKIGNGRVPRPEDFKNPIRITHEGQMHEFAHPVENEIAVLISLKPGDPVIGEPDYESMKQDFVNSLVDKIEVLEDDSEEDKTLKMNVAEIKKDLSERVKAGEDLVEILKDARRELRQSAEYKQQLDEVLQDRIYDPDIPDEDLKLAFEAANKMLEDKGIEPIKETRILRARSRMLRAQERRAAAEAAAAQERK